MIFGIGLPFTGTSSLQYALNYLGYRTVHCPHDRRTLQQLQNAEFAWDILRAYNAAVDLPIASYFKELDKQYPDAKFILTVREKPEWAACMESYWRQSPASLDELNFRQSVYYWLQLNRRSFVDVYDAHLQEILDYFQNQRAERLLVMDIHAGDGWNKLCPFLATDIPPAPFPFPLANNDHRILPPAPEDMQSYRALLVYLCRVLSPKRILEWGPGASTVLLATECPGASILSLEHDRRWFENTQQKVDALPNVELVYCPHLEPFGGSRGYVTYPLRQLLKNNEKLRSFDLIFIDGRSRCDCLAIASQIVSPQGMVVLHDSDRRNYLDGLNLFPAWLQYWDIRTAVAGGDELNILNDFQEYPGMLTVNARQNSPLR